MPRRKKVDEESEPLARLPESAAFAGTGLVSPTDERRERELEEVLEEIGTDGRIRVWHVIDGKAVYAGEMSLDGFTLDALLEHYGGGDKTLVFYQGRKRVETLRVTLDPSIPATNPREQKLAAQREAKGNNGQGTGLLDMAQFLASMAQQSMSNMDMFSKMIMAQQASSAGMMQAITTMLTARPERDPTELMLKVAEILKPSNTGGGAEMLTAFREGIKLAGDLAGKDEDGDGTTRLISEGLGVVGKALEAARPVAVVPPTVATPNVPRQIGTSVTPVTPVASTPHTENGMPKENPPVVSDDPTAPHAGDRPWIAAARPMIPRLSAAIAFLSGDSAAVELLRRASDDVVQDLMDDLDDETPPGFIGRVQRVFPMFQPSSKWADQFIATLRESVEEEPDLADGDDGDDESEAGEPQALIDAARDAARKARTIQARVTA